MKSTVKWLAVVFALLAGGFGASRACDIPVYRYALERWQADAYTAFILNDNPLSREEAAAADILRAAAAGKGRRANLTVVTVDISRGIPAEYAFLMAGAKDGKLPCIVLRLPRSGPSIPAAGVWPLTAGNARMLADSPFRRALSKRIVAGDAVVWVLLESGDRTRDNAAADTLNAAFAGMKRLHAPIPSSGETSGRTPRPEPVFSMLRLSRADAGESALVSLLLRVEPDLEEYPGDPIAFPVFGRGRALYAFVGGGIGVRNIMGACRFMTGDCSCEVKAQNPGLDLLVTADWTSGIGEPWSSDAVTPPLTGLPEIKSSRSASSSIPIDSTGATAPDKVRIASTLSLETGGSGGLSPVAKGTPTAGEAREASLSPERGMLLACFAVIAVAAVLSVRFARGKRRP